MIRQNKFQIYLAGACKEVDYETSNKWRSQLQQSAEHFEGMYVFNPNSQYNYWNLIPDDDRTCMSVFLDQLRQSDLVLVNLDNSEVSVGTGMEVAIAHERGIPVIGFIVKDSGVYKWTEMMCDMVYRNMSMTDILADIYFRRVKG